MMNHRVLQHTKDPRVMAAAQAVILWDLGRPTTYRRRWRRDCYCGLSITDATEIAAAAVAAYERGSSG